MTVLITGATGFLGRNLVPTLIRDGYTVRALCRHAESKSILTRLGVQPMTGDLFDPHALRATMVGVQAVVHAAADTAIWPVQSAAAFRTTVLGTRAVLQAARNEGVQRVVHVGSANSFGPSEGGQRADEHTPFRGYRYRIGYITQKQQAQRIALAADPPAIVVNPTFLFGPHDRAPGAGRLIQQIARQPAAFPYPAAQGRNVAGVDSVCRGIGLALRHGIPGECYLLGGCDLLYRTLFELIRAITARRTHLVPIPPLLIRSAGALGSLAGHMCDVDPGLSLPVARAAGDQFYYSSAKAERELGYLPDNVVAVEQAIRASFAWLCSTGRIAIHGSRSAPAYNHRGVSFTSL